VPSFSLQCSGSSYDSLSLPLRQNEEKSIKPSAALAGRRVRSNNKHTASESGHDICWHAPTSSSKPGTHTQLDTSVLALSRVDMCSGQTLQLERPSPMSVLYDPRSHAVHSPAMRWKPALHEHAATLFSPPSAMKVVLCPFPHPRLQLECSGLRAGVLELEPSAR